MTKGETFKFYNYKLTVLDEKEIHYFKNAYCCYEFLDISKQSFHAILKGRKLKKIPFEFELQRIHIRIIFYEFYFILSIIEWIQIIIIILSQISQTPHK